MTRFVCSGSSARDGIGNCPRNESRIGAMAAAAREAGMLSSHRHVKSEALRNEQTLLSERSKTSSKPIRYGMPKVYDA